MTKQNTNLARRLLKVIADDILPLTTIGVGKGDKVFGAAVLSGGANELVMASTNREHSGGCPLWHGEMAAIADYFALPSRPAAGECVFVSTHEPCPMCASALAWSGFGEVYYLFDYADTAKVFNIPHDENILHELFSPCIELRRDNKFFKMTPISELIGNDNELQKLRAELENRYRVLSDEYQRRKDLTSIPLK